MVEKEDLKKLENEKWKLVAFREYEKIERYIEGKNNVSELDCLFYYKKELPFNIILRVCEEKNFVCMIHAFSDPTEEKLVDGTKLAEKVKEIYFKKSLHTKRLRLLSKDAEYRYSNQRVDLPLYEKKLTREEILSFQDTLENFINHHWKNSAELKKEIKSITLIGEKGKALCELLSDKMFITETSEVGDGVYRLTIREGLFASYYSERLLYPISHKIKELGINVLYL